MPRDKRIIEKETEFSVQGIKKISCKPDYRTVLVEGGATPSDIAYLDAYNSLLKAEPALAKVIAEAYFFSELKDNKNYQKLQRQKDAAAEKQDFDLAAELRDKADALKRKTTTLPKLLEEFSKRLSNIARGLESTTEEK